MGAGKRKSFNNNNKSKVRRPNTTNNNQALFIEAGILSGFDSPSSKHPGKKHNSNGRSSGLQFRDSGANGSNSKSKSRKPNAVPFRYDYPQDISQPESFAGKKNSKGDAIGSQPLTLLGSNDNKIVVFEDPSPSMEAPEVAYNYEYTSGFVLGESSHSGLGISEGPDANVTELSSGLIDEKEEIHRGSGLSDKQKAIASEAGLTSKIVQDGSSSHEIEEDVDDGSTEYDDDNDDDDGDDDDSLSLKENSAFVSIGGIRVYTHDISDSESEDEEDEEGSDDAETSESDDFEDSSDFDDDVMEDYLEGIGGRSKILDSKFLAMQDIGAHQDDDIDDDDSSDEFGDTLKKLSGVALLEASRKYGLPKEKPKKKPLGEAQKSNSKTSVDWSPMDDMVIAKDPRRLSAKKKHVARLPQSDGRKSKRFGRFPGEKKKHRKEMIAVKRNERMLSRGVDLEKINSKLKQMVLNNVDILAFHPMHPRDCSQVQRMAGIYRLKSSCQNSGKKRFVIASITKHTCMPSAIDEVRLQKLIGSSKDDADFLVGDTPGRVDRGSSAQNKSAKKSVSRQVSSGRKSEKRISGKKLADYANQPVSFVPSGVIQSETTQVTVVESNETSNDESKVISTSSMNVGSFEVHTKGFGSKMMAKMGYIEGEGLGKESNGMSKPIEVIQRPKSLGLGMTFEETPNEPVKVVAKQSGGSASGLKSGSKSGSVSARTPKGPGPTMGAFEMHTKGFGSKMMARMGFVDGMGLGRDSQGISSPLTAVKRPKARGLGAEGRT